MSKYITQNAEALYPEDFYESIESSIAELTYRRQADGEVWRGRVELGPTFQKIASLLEIATLLLPDED